GAVHRACLPPALGPGPGLHDGQGPNATRSTAGGTGCSAMNGRTTGHSPSAPPIVSGSTSLPMMLVVLDPGPGARPILGTHYDARGVQKGGPQPGGVAVLVLECRRDTLADQAISDELCLHQVEGREAFDEIRGRFRELLFSLFLASFHPQVV